MPPKPWTNEEDALIRELINVLTDAELVARLTGRTIDMVRRRRRALGLVRAPAGAGEVKASKWVRELEERIGESVGPWLRRRYIDEDASYREITAELGINTRSLMKLMARCQIEPRGGAESFKRQLERDPDTLDRLHKAAGTRRAAVSRAKSREANWARRMSAQEHELLEALKAAGLSPVPQLAIGSYSIDFGFPTHRLAIELDPLWHKSAERLERDQVRDANLRAIGWTVIRLESRRKLETNVKAVLDAVKRTASTQPDAV